MWKEFQKEIDKLDEKQAKKVDKKEQRIKKFRKEVSRKAAIANKRLERLEKAGMTSSPAYEKWQEQGGERFSIRGKDFNEVQSEMARVNAYLNSATSSVSGAKKVIKEMVKNTGMNHQFSDWKRIQQQAKVFFEIASKIEQYLRTVEDRASSVGYQKIWTAINQYVKETKGALEVSGAQIDAVANDVIKAMKVWDEKPVYTEGEGYKHWTELPKF